MQTNFKRGTAVPHSVFYKLAYVLAFLGVEYIHVGCDTMYSKIPLI